MTCTTKAQAIAVAKAGANKMPGKYEIFKPVFENAPDFFIVNLDTDQSYRLTPKEEGGFSCSCPFHEANKQFGVCKHTVYLESQLASEAWAETYFAELDTEAEARHYGEA